MQLIKSFLLSMVIVNTTFAANLTQAQTKQVSDAAEKIYQITLKMDGLARAVAITFIQSGYNVNFSTVAYPLTAQQQQDILNNYASLKAQLQTQLNSLP